MSPNLTHVSLSAEGSHAVWPSTWRPAYMVLKPYIRVIIETSQGGLAVYPIRSHGRTQVGITLGSNKIPVPKYFFWSREIDVIRKYNAHLLTKRDVSYTWMLEPNISLMLWEFRLKLTTPRPKNKTHSPSLTPATIRSYLSWYLLRHYRHYSRLFTVPNIVLSDADLDYTADGTREREGQNSGDEEDCCRGGTSRKQRVGGRRGQVQHEWSGGFPGARRRLAQENFDNQAATKKSTGDPYCPPKVRKSKQVATSSISLRLKTKRQSRKA